jgi:hypothetical protein
MADLFPLALFAPSEHQPYLMGAAQSGGQPLVGPPQTADMATGGWWAYEMQVARLRTRDQFAAWRSFLGGLHTGVGIVEVPILDILQPWPGRGGGTVPGHDPWVPMPVPHSDLTPFDDTSPYDGGSPISATLAAAAYAPAWPAPPVPPTQMQVTFAEGAPLRGGEFFSVIGPSGQVWLHMVTRILATSTDGLTVTVSFVPPLRENLAAATAIDFDKPRFLGKVDVASVKDAWPRISPPFQASPSIRFLEVFAQ